MRTFTLLFALMLTAALPSCNKKDDCKTKLKTKELPGTWELRGAIGGMIAYDPNNYKPGNGNLWKFTQTNFAIIYNDSTYRSGTYSISINTGADPNTNRKIDQFITNGEPAESFELVNDTLKIYYGEIASDGVIQLYVKVSDNANF